MYKLKNIFIFCFSLLIFVVTINANEILTQDEISSPIEQLANTYESNLKQTENIYSKQKEAIVKIYSNINIYNWLEPYRNPENEKIAGSGFFISEDGYILTCYHVVEGASKIYINIPSQGKKQFNCEIVGAYPERDIALIKLKEKDLKKVEEKLGKITYLNLGNSDQLTDSQKLMVLGYPLASDSIQLSEGIFSGKDSDLFGFEVLHTTAPINHGNSGGPTVNDKGDVIGICVSKIEFAEGMGYLIPINDIQDVLDNLFDEQIIRHSFWGIVTTDRITEDTIKYLSKEKLDHGIYIQQSIKDSLGYKYGVRAGDIIYQLNNMPIDIHGEIQITKNEKMGFRTCLNKIKFNDSVKMKILRNEKEIELNIIKEPGNNFNGLKKILPELGDKIDYEIIDGITIMQLEGNHLDLKNLFAVLSLSPNEFLYKNFRPLLIMTHVLPDSEAFEMSFSEQSRILEKINNIKVETLDDLREIVKQSIENKDEYLIFENHIGAQIAIPTEKIIESYEELSGLGINFSSPIFEEVETDT